jgi:predicted O-methyltransferase YrrM
LGYQLIDSYILIELAKQAEREPVYPDPRFPPSLYYRFLKVLAAHLQPNLSVELGVCGGGGSLHLAMGYNQGQVIGVDMADDHPENIKHITENYSNFRFWLGDSIKSAPEIYNEYGVIDILFIDTTHTFTQTVNELLAWKPYLSDKAVVCFDDLFRQEMRGFWDWLEGNKLRIDKLHDGAEQGGGFGIWWKS